MKTSPPRNPGISISSLGLTTVVAAIAGFAAAQFHDLQAGPAQAQGVQRLGHVQAESLTLVGGGRVRGGMLVDHANRAVLELRDPTGNYNGIRILVGNGGNLEILDRNGQPLSLGTGQAQPPLRVNRPAGAGGKADAPSSANIDYLQQQVDALWSHVAEIQNRLNSR